MDEKEFNALVEKLETASGNKITEQVKEALKGLDVEAIKVLLDTEVATKEDLNKIFENKSFTDLQTKMEEATDAINLLKDNQNNEGDEVQSLKESIGKVIRENHDAIKALKDNRQGAVQLKAVGNITTGNNTGRVARQERDPNTIGVDRRNPFMLQLVNTSSTNAGTYYYVERTGHEGAPTMTAEGAVKPQADWDYVERSASAKKITVIVTVSKEMLDDVDGIIADVNYEIDEQIMLLSDDQILTGDGTGNNLSGVEDNATAFAAGALADTVNNASKQAVLRAGVAQVIRQLYDPTHIVLHPDDAASLDLEQGTDDHWKIAPFMSASGQSVAGVPIVTNTNVTPGDFLVGDFSKYKVKIREGLTMDVGYRGAAGDWEKNFVSFLGEMRLFGYIPENHFGAIVKGDFTSAAALLETP